jgi:putative component of membrane protein insertase Oxa1/YidC/SpoIIIJ protein YidD
VSDRRRSRSRRAAAVAGISLALVLALDLARAPQRQWTARAELWAIARYRSGLSPWLARGGVRCRFEPSCSRYAEAAIRADGALVGTARAAWRVLRCGPWTPAGTRDPA